MDTIKRIRDCHTATITGLEPGKDYKVRMAVSDDEDFASVWITEDKSASPDENTLVWIEPRQNEDS